MSAMDHKRGKHERKESSSKLTALVVSALAPLVIDQVTSRRERGVTECILSGHAGVNMKLLVTASDVSKGLVLWRLLLEYISLIILRKIVRMCEQCVPGRIFRPGNEAKLKPIALHDCVMRFAPYAGRHFFGQTLVRRPPHLPDLLLRPCISMHAFA